MIKNNLKEVGELIDQIAENIPNLIDISQFNPLLPEDLIRILGVTIKMDETNKLVTFLCELSAYTVSSQYNVSFNAPSSSGKSYIPTEIATLFPVEDVLELGYSTPTAFFHDQGVFDEIRKLTVIDLSRKIIIFLDQPHMELLSRLRPLLSHDKKEIMVKITDRTQKAGLRTKTIMLRGFPAVIFCTAGLSIDEQEATRFLLLSPEVNQEKIRAGVWEKIKKEADSVKYSSDINNNAERSLLIQRIIAIKQSNITSIRIGSPEIILARFIKSGTKLKPRHQRDIGRLLCIIKALALLNLWWREEKEGIITANNDDINAAFAIWEVISLSQELNLPPYIYNLFQDVIMALWLTKNTSKYGVKKVEGSLGVTRKEILQKHYEVYGRMLDGSQLRIQIIPMLETAGLISQEQDIEDKRKWLIFPIIPATLAEIYSEDEVGVDIEDLIDQFPEEFGDSKNELYS